MDRIRITTGRNRFDKEWEVHEITWGQFVTRMAQVRRTDETMEEYAALPRVRRGNIKDVGGYVGGAMERLTGERNNVTLRSRSLVTIDVDGNSRNRAVPDVGRIRESISGCTYILHSTHSSTPEFPRLRVVLPLSREVTADEYQPIALRVAEMIGLDVVDPTTVQYARIMYWPSVPKDAEYIFETNDASLLDADRLLGTYIDWRNAAEWPGATEGLIRAQHRRHITGDLDGSGRVQDPTLKNGTIGQFCTLWTIGEAIAEFGLPYREAGRGRYTYTGGSSYGGAVVYNGGRYLYSNHATDPATMQLCNAFDLVRIHRFGHLDLGTAPETPGTSLPSFKAMTEWADSLPAMRRMKAQAVAASFADVPDTQDSGKRENRPQIDDSAEIDRLLGLNDESTPEVKESAPADESWTERLDMSKETLKSTAKNYHLLLSNLPVFKDAFRTDIFANRKQVVRALPWDKPGTKFPRDFTDTDRSEIAVYFSNMEKYPVNGGKDNLSAALDSAFNAHQVHPVREMLRSLPEWDGKDRLGTLFCRYLGAADTELNRAIAVKHLTAAVKRVMEPGCKYDQVLVLVGPEGTGKSSIIEKLACGWYQDSNIEVGDKDAYQNLVGHWLIEMAELADYESKSVASYKNFISSTVDRYRPSYGRETVSVYRQCVFFATTNENDFLKGRTGNRRFWVLDCPGSPEGRAALFDGTIDEELPQIWAEAYHYYQERMPLVIDTAMGEEMRSVQARHEILLNDDTTAVIRDYIWRKKPVGWRLMSLERKKAWMLAPDMTPEGSFGTQLEVPEYFCIREIAVLVFGRRPDVSASVYDSKNIKYILDNMEDISYAGSNMKFGDGLGVQRAYRVEVADDFLSR